MMNRTSKKKCAQGFTRPCNSSKRVKRPLKVVGSDCRNGVDTGPSWTADWAETNAISGNIQQQQPNDDVNQHRRRNSKRGVGEFKISVRKLGWKCRKCGQVADGDVALNDYKGRTQLSTGRQTSNHPAKIKATPENVLFKQNSKEAKGKEMGKWRTTRS